jgi:DNA mismatch repair ATPase MutS
MQTQRCFAVNPSVDPLLDVARQTYADVTSDIHDTANKCQHLYPTLNIRLVHNSRRGYHLMMKSSEELNMQSFIMISSKGGSVFFSTEELESLNQKCNEAVRNSEFALDFSTDKCCRSMKFIFSLEEFLKC